MISPDTTITSSAGHEAEDFAEEWDHESPVPPVEDWEAEQAEGVVRERYHLRPSEFVEEAVLVPDPGTRALVPFSFRERPYLRAIYDSLAKRRLLLAGRQVEKSTLLGNYLLTLSCLIPHFKSLYVSPSSQQTKDFSKSRLKETIDTCPVIQTWFRSDLTDNVYEKKALNRSEVKLRYAFLNADRCRGLASDAVLTDEFQDILLDNIPVIEETASHSPFKLFVYSGTPKSLDNPIQFYWDTYSTQNEWAVPCDHHGTPKAPGSWHWNILGEESIGANGIACDKCGNPISAQNPLATWVRTGTPDPKFDVFEGFRIPQLMVPWIEWPNILAKYHQYSRAKFYNEVLGSSFDSGQRPLTKTDVMANCDPEMRLDPEYVRKIREKLLGKNIYAGVDWGQDSTNSYTLLVLGAYLDGFFRIFFAHRFTGAESEPRVQLEKICKIIETFQVKRVGVDHGGGFFPNDDLMRKYGTARVMRMQYSTPSVFMRFDAKLGRYLLHRSEVMSAVFNAVKRKSVFRFPRWADFVTPFASDMLAIFSEYNERTKTTEYKKSPNTTDDTFHAILFCFLASMIEFPREDIFVPGAAVDRRLAA